MSRRPIEDLELAYIVTELDRSAIRARQGRRAAQRRHVRRLRLVTTLVVAAGLGPFVVKVAELAV